MKDRKTVTRALAGQYQKASKGRKGKILDEFVEATGYDRSYASRLLRNHGRQIRMTATVVLEGNVRLRSRRVGHRKYDDEVLVVLKKIWEMLDFISGKLLASALKEVVPRLVACKELRIKKSVQKKLLEISPATIDRMLKPERKKYALKGRAHTKPGTLLKHQIPIRTFSDWNDDEPGFIEMDLVGHDGGNVKGDYCFTLDIVDIATGWTEQAAVPNKAQVWVLEALTELQKRLPFTLRGVDSDNGSEFINNHMLAYCNDKKIVFTRSRPYRKNDNCYVEQKNWSIVRRYVGYARYDTQQVCDLLNELYRVLRDTTNFFLPSMKLKEKTRDGAKVHKRYGVPQTPYQRIMNSNSIPNNVKEHLKRYYQQLNPAAVHRRIRQIQKLLDTLAGRKPKQEAVA